MGPLRLMRGFDRGLLATKEPESVVAAASRMLSMAGRSGKTASQLLPAFPGPPQIC